ncbi:hypothetical protein [Streptacidiphilus sp. PAMC 29251]
MIGRRFAALATALLLAGTSAACGSSKSSSDAKAEVSGPGVYSPTAEPSDLCKPLSYQSFAALIGTPDTTQPPDYQVSKTDQERTTTCVQSLQHQSNGKLDAAAPQGEVETDLTYWQDVDTAKNEFGAVRQDATGGTAKDGATTPVDGVGTEAFQYTLKESTSSAATLFLVARHSNLVITVKLDALSSTPWTDQQFNDLFARMADHIKAVFPVARSAAPAPTGTASQQP